jgi:RNA polymerase sigma-70 factor (ECF subfamily)
MVDQSAEIKAALHRCLAGEQAGYEALYSLCAPTISRLCCAMLMDRQDAEDVMQEVFVYAFRNLRRYDPTKASFKTWLYTIAISRCRNMYRRHRWTRLTSLLSVELPAPRSEAPEAQYAAQHARDIVSSALAELKSHLREAVILRYGHGLTFREMADVIGCPPKTAESRVRLAHERLRSLLQSQGDTAFEELLGVEVWARI